jgi:YVTN family beta-propeller protein
MAGHIVSKRNRSVRAVQTGPRRRAVGVVSGVAAFLALGLSPLAVAPSANADPLTDVLDLIIEPAIAASSGISPAEFFDPGVLGAALSELATPAGWETLATDLSSFASGSAAVSDSGTAAAASDPTSGLEALEQQWIDSSSGQSIDASLNSLFHELDPSSDACGYICNGLDGTGGSSFAAASGQDGGIWFGDGGNGVTDLDGEGGAGGSAGELGDGGSGGNGVDGEAGGAGGAGGFLAGDGGNGGNGGDGLVGVSGGAGGVGGAGGNGGLLGIGGTGGAGGNATDGSAGGEGGAASGSTGGAGGAGGVVGTSGGGGTGPSGGGGLTVTTTDVLSDGQIAVSSTGPEAGDVYTLDWPGYGGSTGTSPGELYVYNPTTNTLVDTINVGLNPDGVAVSPTGPEAGDIYVSNETSGTVSVINPSTNTVVDTINVGLNPIGVAVSPNGPDAGDIYVLDSADSPDAAVQVISPATNTIIDTINLGLITPGIDAIAVSPTGVDAGDVFVAGSSFGGSTIGTDVLSVINTDNELINTFSLPDSTSNQIGDFVGGGGLAVSPTGPDAGDIYIDAYPGDTDNDGLLWIVNLPNDTVNTISSIPAGTDGASTGLGGLGVSPAGPDAGDIYLADPGASLLAVFNPTATEVSYDNLSSITAPAYEAFNATGTLYGDNVFLEILK